MSMSDTAEYWWREPKMPYSGKQFKHNPNHKCSHYNPSTGNTDTTIYIGDINCYECIENISNGIATKEGLKEGKAPETFYMSIKEKKKFNAQKRFNDQYGKCPCGCNWQIRKNKSSGEEFLGCINYPTCKNTKRKIVTTSKPKPKSIDLDKIMNGEICPYCKRPSEYIDSSFIYGKSYGMIYICKACDAYCGVHEGTDKALGRLANAELREYKKQAHAAFDPIWKSNLKSRQSAYKWLSEQLNTPPEYTHIGMFGVETCKKLIEICKNELA